MPRLVRLYIHHCLIGFGLAGVFVALLLWFNVANLWHLISTSPVGWLAALMLVVFNGIVFSGVQFGIAIMRMGDEEPPRRGGNAAQTPQAALAPVAPAKAGRADGSALR